MFRRQKDNEIDITSLNVILRTGKNLINIGYFIAIVCLVLLGTYLIKEWKILKILGEIIVTISPIFIGFLIAWLFDPFVTKLQKRKVPRIAGCIIAYVLLLGILFGISYIVFSSGNQYTFDENSKSIYKNNLKICENVDICDFSYTFVDSRYKIKVNFKTSNIEMLEDNAMIYNL